jgi:transposase InsO family protein
LTGSKKNLVCSAAEKRLLIDTKHPKISVVRQCRLLGLSHSSLYYQPVPISTENLIMMRLLDEEYLVAIIEWFSRYVLDFGLSITLEADFCIEALERALRREKPEIFNSDQGSQFTSPRHTKILEDAGILISMDGKGRAIDNIFVERLWRSLKYEEVYLKDYETVQEAKDGIKAYFSYYNNERP